MINSSPPVVYGELSILGYNGYIPNVEKTGRRNRSKFLLCKRPQPNGIKKSRHYIVKQPQATKAIHDKDLHSISYTFSRSQTIIVEYRQDENTDMFQIGRSSEDPIDFVVMDTLFANTEALASQQQAGGRHHQRSENSTNSQIIANQDPLAINRIHRHLAKVGDDMQNYSSNDPRARFQYHRSHQAQAVLLNYPQPNISNLPPMMTEHFRSQDVQPYQSRNAHQHFLFHGHSSGAGHSNQVSSSRSNGNHTNTSNNNQHERCASNRQSLVCKRSHATQSTISRFACRILVDRKPPYTARIYAAGFDSSKNIFLGEKATKWEQNNSIDGLTTNGVLLMHPKRGQFYAFREEEKLFDQSIHDSSARSNVISCDSKREGDSIACLNNEPTEILREDISAVHSSVNEDIHFETNDSELQRNTSSPSNQESANSAKNSGHRASSSANDSNNITEAANRKDVVEDWHETGGVWREVSVDGGIYAIRESRSAPQKGTRIESETNILQDGTLIDLCGATLLWRSLDGFKASPTRKSLEEKIDMLNASRPQCPVGLNTLVIPRKPILPSSSGHRHKEHHHSKDPEKNSHQPYVYLKCGHVQGYHDWGATDKSNQRTCPICLSIGAVAKLSMGLEPSFYVDSGPLTHVFNPCGHMASERTVRYWCSIKIPHGTHFFHSICPFCASPLATNEPASTRLIFQDDLD